MDIQEKLKLKLQFFAEESNEGNEEIEDNNDDESKDK
ncbi:TPA: phage capsid protein, partial [Staphylococcus aureus]|nr:phage capsid protein [Staphylococcus aureus]HDA2068724.1 phage capsid protein [Staphylococcus aureus]